MQVRTDNAFHTLNTHRAREVAQEFKESRTLTGARTQASDLTATTAYTRASIKPTYMYSHQVCTSSMRTLYSSEHKATSFEHTFVDRLYGSTHGKILGLA